MYLLIEWMIYVHWIVVFVIALSFFRATRRKPRKTLVYGVLSLTALTAVIVTISLYLDRGSVSEIILMGVAHRSSAYLTFTYGVLLGVLSRLIQRVLAGEERVEVTQDGP